MRTPLFRRNRKTFSQKTLKRAACARSLSLHDVDTLRPQKAQRHETISVRCPLVRGAATQKAAATLHAFSVFRWFHRCDLLWNSSCFDLILTCEILIIAHLIEFVGGLIMQTYAVYQESHTWSLEWNLNLIATKINNCIFPYDFVNRLDCGCSFKFKYIFVGGLKKIQMTKNNSSYFYFTATQNKTST